MSGTNRRQATPLSPSPSPEPPEGVERGNNTGGFKPLSIGGASALTGQTGQAGGGKVGLAGQLMSGNGEIYGSLAQEQARNTLEERIRVAIDDLMQLATCAAEVHEGDEDIVRLEM